MRIVACSTKSGTSGIKSVKNIDSKMTVASGVMPGERRFSDDDSGPGLVVFMEVVNALTHILLGAVAFIAFVYANLFEQSVVTSHIYLNVLGYVILMPVGILSISPHSGWARTLTYDRRKMVHLALQLLGTTFVISGTAVIMAEKLNNLNTAHGYVGLFAMIFTILTMLGGLANYFMNLPRLTRIIHFVAGALTIILAFVALIIALLDYGKILPETSYMGTTVAVFALLGIVLPPCFNKFRRL